MNWCRVLNGADGDGSVDENGPIASMIWGRAIQGEGQTFNDAKHFRTVLKNYCISHKRAFIYERNDSCKITAVCPVPSCGWRVYASYHKKDRSFGVRRCNLQHSCGLDTLRDLDNPKADSKWVAAYIKETVRTDTEYKPKNAIQSIKKDFGIRINYHKAWNALDSALIEIHGADNESFDKLRWYCNALKESNPGSIADLEVTEGPETKFRRLFVTFAACVAGFVEGCRPMLFLDGTHIKSKWKGFILCAVAKDADGGFLTVAFACK